MKKFAKYALAVTAITMFIAQADAAGLKYGGTKLGKVEQTTRVEENHNIAQGNRAKAQTIIGAIYGRAAKVKQQTYVKKNTNVARGNGAAACTAIGIIGLNPSC